MEGYTLIRKFLVPVLLIVLVFTVFLLVSDRQKQEKVVQSYKQETIKQKEERIKAEERLERASKELMSEQEKGLLKGSEQAGNNEFVSMTTQLFSVVYTYQSDKETDTVKARKEKASAYANQKALNGLFPKDAEKAQPSVTTSSRLEKNPEIYQMITNENEVNALVVISYSLSIAGSKPQTGSFLYKTTFDRKLKQFVAIKNLGEINVS
ncbi:hypothetical protein SHT67_14305 (plasmid) [Enterococcus faecalis]|uniref:hypothetical protein n=1 Tax=Enterococcus faecalis TaxID=1351 RepID=UPI0029C7EE0E|nr:hypothetical protein [Enterococcus faecalis]WPH48347.1 hypothetical protein SHT67_14305 [Enterococcus faecalis]